MKKVEELSVKIFADGADKAGMLEMYGEPYIKGLTTNPTLMRKAELRITKAFARTFLQQFLIARFLLRCFLMTSTIWNGRP